MPVWAGSETMNTGKNDIYTFLDCPDGKFSIAVFCEDYTTDICYNISVDGKNAHNCLELCTTGFQGLFCPRGYAR
jgi:hypothetical protein